MPEWNRPFEQLRFPTKRSGPEGRSGSTRSRAPLLRLKWRVCVWDTWLSGIFLGRTAATIAELCFALQCAFFVQRLSEITGMRLVDLGHAFVPLVIVAEIVCWHAVLSLNHIGRAIEETLWALMMLILSAAFGMAAFAGTRRRTGRSGARNCRG